MINQLLRIYPLKVDLNILQDAFSLVFEMLGNPLKRIGIILGVVTTVQPVFPRMARWYDVIGRVAAAHLDGNKVILSQRMPETNGTATVSTTMSPIFKATLPIDICKGCWQIAHPGAAAMRCDTANFWMRFMKAGCQLQSFLPMLLVPSAICFANSVGMILTILATLLSYMLTVGLSPKTHLVLPMFPVILRITLFLYTHFVRVFFAVTAFKFSSIFGMLFAPLLIIRRIADFTVRAQLRATAFDADKCGKRLELLTLQAPFEWKRLVDHLWLFPAGSAVRGCGQAAKQAVRPVNYAELVHFTHFTTNGTVAP